MVGEFLKPDNALKGASSGISRRMIQERRQCRDETLVAAAEEEEEAEDEEAVQ